MKKYLFLVLLILSIFFITDRVEALSFTVNGKSVEVSEENLIYYIYSQKKDLFNSYDYFYLLDNGENLSYSIYFTNFPKFILLSSMGRYGCNGASSSNPCVYVKNSIYNSTKDYAWSTTGSTEITKTSRFNVSNYGTAHIISSNYENLVNNGYEYNLLSKEDLQNYFNIKEIYKITYYVNNEVYKELEVEEGSSIILEDYSYNSDMYNFSGWTVEDNKDLTNITSDIVIRATLEQKYITPVYIKNINDFPIQKTEFYALLVLLGTFIIMLFLKWCFPFKGGSDLK